MDINSYGVYVDRDDKGWVVTRRCADEDIYNADVYLTVYEENGFWWVYDSTAGSLQLPSEELALHVAKFMCASEDTVDPGVRVNEYKHLL